MSPEEKAKSIIEEFNYQSPQDVDPEQIAWSNFLAVEFKDMSSHIGRIKFDNECGVVSINRRLKEPGQKRFTLAHELGHFFNESGSVLKSISCTPKDINSGKFTSTFEQKANLFASELLMYKPWFSDFVKNKKINMNVISEIAGYFGVSLSAAALRYVYHGKYPIAVILSRNGMVEWSAISPHFPLRWIPKGYKVRKESNAYEFFNGGKTEEWEDLIPAHAWFSDDYKCPKDLYIFEQCTVMKNYNAVMTLLWEE